MNKTQAILVLPRLRVQNANAISSPMTHGFMAPPSFVGLMWALERNLQKAGVPLVLNGVGVVCHHHQEQVTDGYVKTFNLTRNPVGKKGEAQPIVEEGRMHAEITLVFSVCQRSDPGEKFLLSDANAELMGSWAETAGEIISGMRVAGGSVLPSRPLPGVRVRPWMAVVPDDASAAQAEFVRWRRSWLPGFALVGRDDLLAQRLAVLRESNPEVTPLDAWLHACRSNHQPVRPKASEPKDGEKQPEEVTKFEWVDPWRTKSSGWIVPVAVGYRALGDLHAPGVVQKTRDPKVPFRFVEAIHTLGEWIGPHRLSSLNQLLWWPETDDALGVYRCRSGYQSGVHASEQDDWCDYDAYG